jgi:hypothetical protein
MTFTAPFEFSTDCAAHVAHHEARVTYTVSKGRAQTYGQPAEAPEVGDMDFEINLSGNWHKASDDLHDLLLQVLGDDLDWLIDHAREAALEAAMDAAE